LALAAYLAIDPSSLAAYRLADGYWIVTVSEKVQAVLAGGAVTTFVPAARIKVPGDWQNLARPYIVHFPVSPAPTQTHGGRAALIIWEFYQVSIFADTYSTGEEAAIAVRDNLPGVHDGVHIFWHAGGWYIGKDDDTGVHHFALDFKIAEAL